MRFLESLSLRYDNLMLSNETQLGIRTFVTELSSSFETVLFQSLTDSFNVL